MEKPTESAAPAAHGHPPHLAHHFATAVQQFDSGKLGMWLFLATEILLFGGLFCAYAVYRGLHPDVFLKAHTYLSVELGAVNTIILLCSSFTMACAVHAAQRCRQKLLVWMLGLTLLGGGGFLGIKSVEYHHKWKHHLLWGARFNPDEHEDSGRAAAAAHREQPADVVEKLAGAGQRWEHEPAATGPRGLLKATHVEPARHEVPEEVHNMHVFFGIYFAMTGLHGIHVIAGMLVIAWLLRRATKGHFDSEYFTPVDFGGLYWHLVDMIWIYLFPLLYLIH